MNGQHNNTTQNMASNYPPEIVSPTHLRSILTQIKDHQANHGSLLKVIGSDTPHSVHLQPVSTSVFPTLFPRRLFNEATEELQLLYNELYCKIAEDVQWLYAVTGPLRGTEPLVDALWCVYEEVQRRLQVEGSQYIKQNVHAGVFRSDYMLHIEGDGAGSDADVHESWTRNLCLKQVEFNSYSCAGGCHADKVANMHRFLARRGVYDFASSDNERQEELAQLLPSSLPENNTINGIASTLASAHRIYGPKPYCPTTSHTGVLMVVQPNNFNIADERPIEYALWNWPEGNPIPTYRIEWQLVLRHTKLTPTGELLFFPPENGDSIVDSRAIEISVIYHRAGYEPHEYSEKANGKEIRTRLELSRAIKCPSILGHITTIKKVQQALNMPGTLEIWLSSEKADKIRRTFVAIHSLDQFVSSAEILEDEELTENYILKPVSREGGGHNIYGAKIPAFLKTLSPEAPERSAYILMQRIRSPLNVYGMLMSSSRGVVADEVVSELGVFGGCLWEQSEPSAKGERCRVIENRVVGWSFKTKEVSVDEMSVVKGYGCFDTPLLVD